VNACKPKGGKKGKERGKKEKRGKKNVVTFRCSSSTGPNKISKKCRWYIHNKGKGKKGKGEEGGLRLWKSNLRWKWIQSSQYPVGLQSLERREGEKKEEERQLGIFLGDAENFHFKYTILVLGTM